MQNAKYYCEKTKHIKIEKKRKMQNNISEKTKHMKN